jgi:hypothetical protein
MIAVSENEISNTAKIPRNAIHGSMCEQAGTDVGTVGTWSKVLICMFDTSTEASHANEAQAKYADPCGERRARIQASMSEPQTQMQTRTPLKVVTSPNSTLC